MLGGNKRSKLYLSNYNFSLRDIKKLRLFTFFGARTCIKLVNGYRLVI